MAEANFKIRLSVGGVSEVTSALGAIQGVASRVAGAMTSLAGLAGITTGLAGMAAAIGKSVSFNAQLEQQGVAFKTLLNNADAAAQRMKDLTKFAAETPFELPEVVNASKVLQAMTNGAMAAGDGLRLVGDAAAASGRNLDETAMWIGRLYAGLQSGTPVGEATLRLIEMGLISGTTARKLNELAQTGEGAGKAFQIIQENFGRFSGSMKEQSQTFNGLWSTLKDTANMALADIGKPLFDTLKGALQAAIPAIEEFGKDASATLAVIFDAWRNGQIGELIGLTIQAGFEIGVNAAGQLLQKLFDWLGSGSMWAVIGNALLTSINEAMKLAGSLMVDYLLVPLGSIASYVSDAFSYAFEGAVDFFAGALESVINGASEMLGKLLGREFSKVSLRGDRVFQAPDFMRSFAENQAGGQVLKDSMKEFFDGSTNAGRELMGIGNSLSVGTDALDSWKKLIASQRAAADAARSGDWQGPLQQIEKEVPVINAKLKAQEMELTVTKALQGINQSRAAVEANWLMSSTDKYKQKVRLLEEEKAILEAQRSALGTLSNAPGISTADRMSLLKDQQGVEGRIGQVDTARGQMGPDPTSYTQQFAATFQSLADQAAITAQSVAQTFADVFNNAIQSISSGITGLIMGTQTWGQALMNIGTSILTSIVGAIVQMGVRWVATQILMATVGKSIMLASVAATAPIAAAAAAIWASPATLATIASYGAAAAAAPGFIGTAQAIVMTQSVLSAGFRDGGYTGAGAPDEVAGVVHRGEFVIPADAVNRIGLDTLESMRAGETSGAAIPTSAGAPSPITLNMGVFDNPARLNDWARSQEGRTVLVDIMRQHAHEMGAA